MAFIGENRVKVNAETAMQHLMDSEAPVETVETAKTVEKEEAPVEKEMEKEVPVDGEHHEEVEL